MKYYVLAENDCQTCDNKGFVITDKERNIGEPCPDGLLHNEQRVDADEWLLSRLADVRYSFGQDDGRECLVDPRWNSNDVPIEI